MERNIDYIYFLKENNVLLEELKNHVTMTYDLLRPVMMAMDHLSTHKDVVVSELTKDDLEDLFSEGYYYLYNAVDNIKSVLSEDFDDDIEEMIAYDSDIYLLIRLDEVNTLLEGKDKMISALLDQVDLIIQNRKTIDSQTTEKVEKEIDKAYAKLDTYSTSDRFADLSEAMGLELI